MSHANQDYLSKITIQPDYDRPVFEMPDLESPDGNTFTVASKVFDCLSQHGFKKEAIWLAGGGNSNGAIAYYASANALMFQCSYHEHPNLLTRFMVLDNKEGEEITEDSDFVYIKRRKPKQVLNLPLFRKLLSMDPSLIQKSYQDKPSEFVQENNFERNALFYIENSNSLAWFLAQNKQDGLLDLFHTDVFGQTALHATLSMKNFVLIAEEMYKQDPELTQEIFNQHDIFGHGCFMTMDTITQRELKSINQQNIQDFADFLGIALLISPENAQELMKEEVLKKLLNIVKTNDKFPIHVDTFKCMVEKKLLEFSLPEAEGNSLKLRL